MICGLSTRKKKENKAGYTATSCGQVGRGGNARFHSFRLVLTDGPTNQRTDGRTDGRTDKASYRVACPQLKSCKCEVLEFLVIVFCLVVWLSDGQTDRRTDGRTDKASYRVACPQLKMQ